MNCERKLIENSKAIEFKKLVLRIRLIVFTYNNCTYYKTIFKKLHNQIKYKNVSTCTVL